MPAMSIAASESRIPFALKLAYTVFMAVLIPVYWRNYGPANFFYFCDVALILTLVGLWREDRLLISMCAVGIVAPQILWLADYLVHFVGLSVTGMTDYMFDQSKSLFLRGLSLFHGWLPLLLLYLVARVGYDGRALRWWTLLAWALILICYFLLPGPRPDPGNAAVNINYVHGFSDTAPQTWMHPLLWLATMAVVMPVVLFIPTHLVLQRFFGCPHRDAVAMQAPTPR